MSRACALWRCWRSSRRSRRRCVKEITGDGTKRELTLSDGSIRFDHVYFKYHPDSAEWNLTDIDFSIASGMTVGILGGTGSAKSTLVSLIPRLYEATEGPSM